MFIDLFLGLFLLREFISWKFTPLTSPAILWVLHLGLFWLPIALIISALSLALELLLGTSFYFLGTHLIALGFLTTILIGFGTRVTYRTFRTSTSCRQLCYWYICIHSSSCTTQSALQCKYRL